MCSSSTSGAHGKPPRAKGDIGGLVNDAVVGVENVLRRLKADRANRPHGRLHPIEVVAHDDGGAVGHRQLQGRPRHQGRRYRERGRQAGHRTLHREVNAMTASRLTSASVILVAGPLAGCATPPAPDPTAEVPYCHKTN